MAMIIGPALPRSEPSRSEPSVSVVITTFNHAHFLADAISSVQTQTHAAQEILVIDDGSDDDPAAVVAQFQGVRLLRQANQGLSGARNAGLNAVQTDMVVFLDADDRLLPAALERGLECHASNESCALVYGGFRFVSEAWEPDGAPRYSPIGQDPFLDLLQMNLIAMHATVMYRRAALQQAGGFDPALRRCEDYDVYLRLASRQPIASYPDIVAEYRRHGDNMSRDSLEMLRWALLVQSRHADVIQGARTRQAVRAGRENWRRIYVDQFLAQPGEKCGIGFKYRKWMVAFGQAPGYVARRAVRKTFRRFTKARTPRVGRVRFGDLARTTPIDSNFGYGRGTPVDRFYIERFLQANRLDVSGRVLEVGDDSYSRRFGAGRVHQQDVLHVDPAAPLVTIVGDLAQAGALPADAFDCIILTQTLHLIWDMGAAVAELHRGLRSKGILLLTVPGISPVDRLEWNSTWYWSLTPVAVRRLLEQNFGAASIELISYGNVFAATAFLHGVALEEVGQEMLTPSDPAYPVVVAVRARKA